MSRNPFSVERLKGKILGVLRTVVKGQAEEHERWLTAYFDKCARESKHTRIGPLKFEKQLRLFDDEMDVKITATLRSTIGDTRD